ncbi:hypothetical protein B0T24DRAFT_621958 [Lasiosphaeria ovina]|uniref:Transmembrane protein n=1 Tax=Lasiosphaeria ovina TaxID=92902 RepID=A0AAE0N6W1_9PEZI|nr:hypothetical protein B0T24DRAFT_621958 [Lasiosphaeria ovina]
MSTTAFQPTMRKAARAQTAALRMPVARTAPSLIVPTLVVAGAVYAVATYVRSQLSAESETMNRMFAQQNTPQVMESRRKSLLVDTEGDPRKTIYNVLNW